MFEPSRISSSDFQTQQFAMGTAGLELINCYICRSKQKIKLCWWNPSIAGLKIFQGPLTWPCSCRNSSYEEASACWSNARDKFGCPVYPKLGNVGPCPSFFLFRRQHVKIDPQLTRKKLGEVMSTRFELQIIPMFDSYALEQSRTYIILWSMPISRRKTRE